MSSELDLPLLRAYVTSVRLGSISRAAVRMGRTQPAISQQLRRLEDIVGEPLLRRLPSGVAPTAAGEALLPRAERILAIAAEAMTEMDERRRFGGHCGVGLLEDLATPSLVRGLADFAVRHPNATLEVVMLSGPAMGDAFDANRVQLVLGDTGRLGQPPCWSTRQPIAWVSAPHFTASGETLPLVLFSSPCQWRDIVLRSLDSVGTPWRIAYESTNLAGVLAGVRAGLGLTVLLTSTVPADLVEIPRSSARAPLPPVNISLVRRPDSAGNKLVDAVEGLLKQLV